MSSAFNPNVVDSSGIFTLVQAPLVDCENSSASKAAVFTGMFELDVEDVTVDDTGRGFNGVADGCCGAEDDGALADTAGLAEPKLTLPPTYASF